MAWLWWLLAPVVSTVLGALVLAARARRENRAAGRPQDAMAQHRRLIEALQRSAIATELPATMVVVESGPDSLTTAG